MSKTQFNSKFKWITLTVLALLFALVFGFAVQSLPAGKAEASTYSPSAIFDGLSGGSVGPTAEGDTKFTAFSFDPKGEEPRVAFRRNLALKWFEADEGASDGFVNPNGTAGYFSMRFAFNSFAFTTFKAEFKSSEENVTKDKQTTNSVLFKTEENGTKFRIAVVSSSEQKTEEKDLSFTDALDAVAGQDLTVSFTGDKEGDFTLAITYGETAVVLPEGHDCFTNIGGNYLENRSENNTTPQVPLTFYATFPADATEKVELVAFKELNRQSFTLYNGQVEDTADPVLVLNEELHAFTLGQSYSVSPTVIDVCISSPSTPDRKFYMVRDEKEQEGYHKPVDGDDSDYKTLTSNSYFMPTSDTNPSETEYVAIRYKLTDGSSYHHYKCEDCGYIYHDGEHETPFAQLKSSGDGAFTCPGTKDDGTVCGADKSKFKSTDYFVYLDWYAAKDSGAVETLDVYAEGGNEKLNAIVVTRADKKIEYSMITADEAQKTNVLAENYDAVCNNYAERVKMVAEDLSAGDGAYFYLPSLRTMFRSKDYDYRNLRFIIYYKAPGLAEGSAASATSSLLYSGLRFEIEKDGDYKFRVLAQDTSGNGISLYDKNGKLVKVTASNIWDFDEIPEFSFHVNYTGATVEEQEEGFEPALYATYTFENFEIIAIPGYETEYTLYRLDDSLLPSIGIDSGRPEYEDCWKSAEEYFNRYYNNGEGALVEIGTYNSDISEDDPKWKDTDNDYNWDPDSSLSFTPQLDAYYFLEVLIYDADYAGEPTKAYQVIWAKNTLDSTGARTNWVKENMVSVILFSISGALAIAIVVLFVVKPSDKNVEDVDLEKLKGRKPSKK